MSKCININHADFKELVNKTNLNPLVLASKMGAYMTEHNTDEWPTLKELGLASRQIRNQVTKDFNHSPNKVYSEKQIINLANQIKKFNQANDVINYKFNKIPYGSNSYTVKLISYNVNPEPKTYESEVVYYPSIETTEQRQISDQALIDQEEGPLYEQRIAYGLKVTEGLMKIKDIRKTIRLNSKDKPYIEKNLRKQLSGKGVTDQQIDFIFEYMKDNNIQSMNTEDLAVQIASEFAYTVESEIQTDLEAPTDYKRTQSKYYREQIDNADKFYKVYEKDNKKYKEIHEDFEKKKAIMLKVFPFVEEVIEDYDIDVAGLVEAGGTVIRVNPKYWTTDTIGHEFAHILIDTIGGLSNPLVRRGIELLKDSDIWNEVKDRYSDLYEVNDDRFYKEVLAEAIGRETAVLYDESKQPSFTRWLKQLLAKIKQVFGFKSDNEITELAKMIISGTPIAQSNNTIGYNEQKKKVADIIEEELADIEKSKKTKIEALRDRSLNALKRKSKIYTRKDRKNKTEYLDRLIKEIENEDNDIAKSLAKFQHFLIKQTDNIYTEFVHMRDTEELSNPITLRRLAKWNDYVNGFDTVEDLISLATDIEEYIKVAKETKRELGQKEELTDSNYEDLSNMLSEKALSREQVDQYVGILKSKPLQDVVDKRNKIKAFYLSKGTELVVEFLTPYSSTVTARFKEELEKEYYASLTPEQRKKSTRFDVDNYINEQLELRKDQIATLTKNTVQKELEKASRDIGYMERWADNILDSPDVVISAMVKAFQETMYKARKEKIEFKVQLLEKLRKLEGVINTGITSDLMKAYDFMLEKDEQGNYTGYIISEHKSTMWQSYNNFVDMLLEADWSDAKFLATLQSKKILWVTQVNKIKSGEMTIDNAISAAKAGWKGINTPLNEGEFNKARKAAMKDMIARGIMNETEARFIEDSLTSLIRREIELHDHISDRAAEAYDSWVRENINEYREPIKEWRNDQYDDLMKIDKNDPRREFYDFITSNIDNYQKEIPYAFKLNERIPTVIKTSSERLTAKDNTFADVAKHSINSTLNVLADETERGIEEVQDEAGNKILFVPIYHTNNLDQSFSNKFDELKEDERKSIISSYENEYKKQPEMLRFSLTLEQYAKQKWANKESVKNLSFDLAGSYYKYFASVIDFKHKRDILPQMEMAKQLVKERKVTKTNAKGLPKLGKKSKEESTIAGQESHIYKQLEDWFEAMIYGVKEKEAPKWFKGKVDSGKVANTLGRFTSLNLLGLNVVAGTANVILGSTMQFIESAGGEYYKPKDLIKARTYYMKNMVGIIADIGQRHPKHIVNLLNEEFDILNEYEDGKFRENSVFRKLWSTNTLFATTHMGEHWMQTSVMLAMLGRLEAYDTKGNSIGKMLDLAKVENGRLVFKDVNGNAPANWNDHYRVEFANRVKRVLSSLHGEYSEEGRLAIQRAAAGRLAVMFRKFIPTGIRRRYGKKRLNNLLGEYNEGYYRVTARFMGNLLRDMKIFKFTLATEEWNSLTDKEKAAIRKTLTEVSFMLAALVMAGVIGKLKDDDDDDEWALSFLEYQVYRFRAELWFFANPSESLKILRSPTASMSVLENTIKLTGQLMHPLDEYERGSWKGKKKITKTMIDFLPAYKQIYRMKYVSDQSSWLKN